MSRKDDVFKPALSKIKVPLLVLDNSWHKLFAQVGEPVEIKKMEKRLNELLKEQGKVNNDLKKLKACKKKLMDEIILLANQYGAGKDEAIDKEMDRHKKLVKDCNDRIEEMEDDAQDIPKEIREINYELMLKTMELCYQRLKESRREIETCEEKIQKARVELRENMDRKQENEENVYALYSYMNHIFGKDVINIFDMHYNPEEYRPKRKEDGYIE